MKTSKQFARDPGALLSVSRGPVLGAIGLRRYRELSPSAADVVSRRFLAEHGAEYRQFGARGYEACRVDIAYHLEFLASVFEFGMLTPMVDYLHWVESVLASRQIPAGHLARALDWISEYLGARLDPRDAAIVTEAIARVKAGFLAAREADPAVDARKPEEWTECTRFVDALLGGERRDALWIVDHRLSLGHTVVEAGAHLIQPALYEIGRRWQMNEISVAQEHLATATAQSVMMQALAHAMVEEPNGRTAVLACVEGNQHSIGLQMVADALHLSGWRVQYLGANVPTVDLLRHIGLLRPDLVGLSVAFAHQLHVVREVIARLGAAYGPACPPVIVGGRGTRGFDDVAATLGADAWSADAGGAVRDAGALSAHGARA